MIASSQHYWGKTTMIDLENFSGYLVVYWMIRLLSFAIAIMAVWGLYDPRRFFGERIFAGIGLFMSGQIYLFSMIMTIH